MDSIGRYINHSLHPNIQLMKPIEARGKIRIGFVAKRVIHPGVELLWNYGFDRKNGELPPWYTNPQTPSQTPDQHPANQPQPSIPDQHQPQPDPAVRSRPAGRKEVTCMVPGCGQRVKKIWNHLYQTKQHSNLSGESVCMMHTCTHLVILFYHR